MDVNNSVYDTLSTNKHFAHLCNRLCIYNKIYTYKRYHNMVCINPFKPAFTIVIFIHYKSRIAAAIRSLDKDDLMWCKIERKLPCIGKPVSWKFSF